MSGAQSCAQIKGHRPYASFSAFPLLLHKTWNVRGSPRGLESNSLLLLLDTTIRLEHFQKPTYIPGEAGRQKARCFSRQSATPVQDVFRSSESWGKCWAWLKLGGLGTRASGFLLEWALLLFLPASLDVTPQTSLNPEPR